MLLISLLGAVWLMAGTPALAAEPEHDAYTALHAWSVGQDPKALDVWTERHLALADAAIGRLLAVSGPRTLANTIRPFDEANAELTLAYNETSMMASLHHEAQMRDEAQVLQQRVSSAATALSLQHAVYEALKAVPEEGLDAQTRNLIARSLLEFRLAGVDRSAGVRDQIQELQDRINEISLEFSRNIANDVHVITVSYAELDGLPADFIARHPVDAHGNVTVTTEESDVGPIASFANSADLRHKIAVAYSQRAYPANRMVLISLLQARYELATLLGYKSFADLDLADQMIGSSAQASTFLAEVDAATREPANHEYRRLLRFAQNRDPSIKSIGEADWRYWIEQYRRAVYQFDAQSVRAYFPYEEVQAGVLRTAGRMFHVEFKAITDQSLWDPTVSEFAVMDHGRKIGVIYLDMHPRPGKDKGFSNAPLVPGMRGKQLPEAVLMGNFPGGVPGDPGLMEYSNVVTFIHEFGHLMHHVLGGQGPWSMQEGENVERDFVEAPSQMLEAFFSDPKVLDSFARRLDTDEPIPAELVQRMNEASTFGRAMTCTCPVMARSTTPTCSTR